MKPASSSLILMLIANFSMAQGNSSYTSGSQTDTQATDQSATAAKASPSAVVPVENLTGMDKIEYASLIELTQQAQQSTDFGTQKKLLRQFMDASGPFLQKHPMQMQLWQGRAAGAISLDEPLIGYEAGQKLLASGLSDSDANITRLLAQLNLKGWLDKDKAVIEQNQINESRKQSEAAMMASAGTFTVLGEVNHPGTFPLHQDITVDKAIESAGGFTDLSNKRMFILQRANGVNKIKVTPKNKSTIQVLPGDTIIVSMQSKAK